MAGISQSRDTRSTNPPAKTQHQRCLRSQSKALTQSQRSEKENTPMHASRKRQTPDNNINSQKPSKRLRQHPQSPSTQSPKPNSRQDPTPHQPPHQPPVKESRKSTETPSPSQAQQLNRFTQLDPVAHWTKTGSWPASYKMDQPRPQSPSIPSKRSLSISSGHRQDVLAALCKDGIYTNSSTLLQKSSKDYCATLFEGGNSPQSGQFPCYPPYALPHILERIESCGEERLFRDITPWVVPSPENLYFSGHEELVNLGEDISIPWSRCSAMGQPKLSIPKPDMTIGYLPGKAFTEEECAKLNNYQTRDTPFLFTHRVAFPFLIVEAKIADTGLSKADRQNLHSGSLGVKAIFSLYNAAFPDRPSELNGIILVFTISHNHNIAYIWGHYAVQDTNGIKYYRHEVNMFSFTSEDGANRFKAYNFVFNLYKKYAPKHLEMIQKAVKALPTPNTLPSGLSFDASSIQLNEGDTEGSNYGNDRSTKRPTNSTAWLQRLEQQMKKQAEQLEQQMKIMEREREDRDKERAEMNELMKKQNEMILEKDKKLMELMEKMIK